MLIGQILARKGSDVVTIAPDAGIAELSRLLAERNIGAVLVTGPGDSLVGIVSERDVARGLARHGAALLQLRVAELMTREVVTCSTGDTLEQLMREMTLHRIRHLPVVEDGRLSGMISIGDVVKHRLQELEDEAHNLQEYITSAR
jgi:CBS domain-containing protein